MQKTQAFGNKSAEKTQCSLGTNFPKGTENLTELKNTHPLAVGPAKSSLSPETPVNGVHPWHGDGSQSGPLLPTHRRPP